MKRKTELGGSKSVVLRAMGNLAYIRKLPAAEAKKCFPGVPEHAEDRFYFVLFASDGTPLALSSTLEGVRGDAGESELDAQYVH